MKLTRAETDMAATAYIQWRERGTPTLITSHEAFVLTNGRVGVEGHASNNSVRLVEVAQAYARSFSRPKGN